MNLSRVFKEIKAYELENRFEGIPDKLYEAKNYLISIGGKRARPAAFIASAIAFGGDLKYALPAAWCFELFHNFTLSHDDIMDEAPLRRGMPSLHKKYDMPTAILAGDNMMLFVYKELFNYSPNHALELSQLITQTGIEICEGQFMDMGFEESDQITEEEYIEMIKLKTSVLLGACFKGGAILANANAKEQNEVYELGINLGLGFQIKDDLLDAFSENPKVGKVQGGDIIAGKKTILWTRAMELSNETQKEELSKIYSDQSVDPQEKISSVLQIFKDLKIEQSVSETMNAYYDKAQEQYHQLPSRNKEVLGEFISYLTQREY